MSEIKTEDNLQYNPELHDQTTSGQTDPVTMDADGPSLKEQAYIASIRKIAYKALKVTEESPVRIQVCTNIIADAYFTAMHEMQKGHDSFTELIEKVDSLEQVQDLNDEKDLMLEEIAKGLDKLVEAKLLINQGLSRIRS